MFGRRRQGVPAAGDGRVERNQTAGRAQSEVRAPRAKTHRAVRRDHEQGTRKREEGREALRWTMGKKKSSERDDPKSEKLDRKSYEKELERLHVELVSLQRWVQHK